MDLAKLFGATLRAFEAYKKAAADKQLTGDEIAVMFADFLKDSGLGAMVHVNVK